jgi:hypothetical protein
MYKMHAKLYFGNLKGRDHLGKLGVDRRVILKLILKKDGVRMCTEFNWLGIRSTGGLFWTL